MTGPSPILTQTITLTDAQSDRPLSITASVVSIERREENGIYGRIVGLDSRLLLKFPDDQQHSYFLSRLTGEPFWVQDAHFDPNSFPYFSNGFGTRSMKLRGISAELETLLDQVARSLGLVTSIGPDVPLALAEAGEISDESSDVPSWD